MQTIPIDEILIPEDRQRREFDKKKLEELATSIDSKGLLHPIVLRYVTTDGDADEYHLVAGERRMRAVMLLDGAKKLVRHQGRSLEPGHIPFTLIEDLSEDLRIEAELEENTIRVDLTPMEKALAIKKLHELRVRQKGEFDSGASQFLGEQVGHSVKDTAKEVYGDKVGASGVQDIRDALLIAQHADDPEVAAAPTKAEALKAIRKTAEAKQRIQKAASFDASKTPHKLIQGNCVSIIQEGMFDGVFDVVITDPPYGIGIDKSTGHEYDDSEEYFEKLLAQLPSLLLQVTKPQAHVYVFCDYSKFAELFATFELGGFTCWPRPLIWDKGNVGSFGNIEVGFRKTYECLLFANRGAKKMQVGSSEVLSFAPVSKPIHPAEKPVDLLLELLRRSASTGDRIFDPFCGSGPVFDAAQKASCVATGIELDDKFYALSTNRLQLLTGQITKEDVTVSLDDLA